MMERRRILVIAGLMLALAAVIAYLAYTRWGDPAADHPTLMYFRADL